MYFIKNITLIVLLLTAAQAIGDTVSTVTTIINHGGKAKLTTGSAEYTFKVPKNSIIKHSFVTRDFVGVANADMALLFSLDDLPASNKQNYNPAYYNLFTRRDVLLAIYDEKIKNNPQANEARKAILDLGGEELRIYNRGKFLFFRNEAREIDGVRADIKISSPIDDEVIGVTFFDAANESMIMGFINSLSVKRQK